MLKARRSSSLEAVLSLDDEEFDGEAELDGPSCSPKNPGRAAIRWAWGPEWMVIDSGQIIATSHDLTPKGS